MKLMCDTELAAVTTPYMDIIHVWLQTTICPSWLQWSIIWTSETLFKLLADH